MILNPAGSISSPGMSLCFILNSQSWCRTAHPQFYSHEILFKYELNSIELYVSAEMKGFLNQRRDHALLMLIKLILGVQKLIQDKNRR